MTPRDAARRQTATMILRRPYLVLALAALSKADENYNLAVPDQDDEAALLEGDDWRDHHPDWIHEVAYNQQCQEKLQKEREQRWICDARWCDSEGRDCYDGPPPHHLKYGTSSVGSEVKKCIFSQVPDECRGRYNYACCKHKPSGVRPGGKLWTESREWALAKLGARQWPAPSWHGRASTTGVCQGIAPGRRAPYLRHDSATAAPWQRHGSYGSCHSCHGSCNGCRGSWPRQLP